MPEAERFLSGFHPLRLSHLQQLLGIIPIIHLRIHRGVQPLQPRREPESAQQGQRDNDEQQISVQRRERLARLEPFREQMRHGDTGADAVQHEVAFEHELRCTAAVGFGQEGEHLLREERRASDEGHKDRRAEPDGGIQQTEKADYSEHGWRLERAAGVAKLRFKDRVPRGAHGQVAG